MIDPSDYFVGLAANRVPRMYPLHVLGLNSRFGLLGTLVSVICRDFIFPGSFRSRCGMKADEVRRISVSWPARIGRLLGIGVLSIH